MAVIFAKIPHPVEPSIVFIQKAPAGLPHGNLPRQSTPPSIPVPARIFGQLAGVVSADEGDRVHELLLSLVALCFGGASARWWRHIMGYEVVLLRKAESGSP